jgi:hypothetical protein
VFEKSAKGLMEKEAKEPGAALFRQNPYIFFLLLFYHFYIYLHMYTLFVHLPLNPSPPTPPLPGRTCSIFFLSDFVEEKTQDIIRKT